MSEEKRTFKESLDEIMIPDLEANNLTLKDLPKVGVEFDITVRFMNAALKSGPEIKKESLSLLKYREYEEIISKYFL